MTYHSRSMGMAAVPRGSMAHNPPHPSHVPDEVKVTRATGKPVRQRTLATAV